MARAPHHDRTGRMVGSERLEAALSLMAYQGRSGVGCPGVLLRFRLPAANLSPGYMCDGCGAVASDIDAARFREQRALSRTF